VTGYVVSYVCSLVSDMTSLVLHSLLSVICYLLPLGFCRCGQRSEHAGCQIPRKEDQDEVSGWGVQRSGVHYSSLPPSHCIASVVVFVFNSDVNIS
jgi:hypothetical protein